MTSAADPFLTRSRRALLVAGLGLACGLAVGCPGPAGGAGGADAAGDADPEPAVEPEAEAAAPAGPQPPTQPPPAADVRAVARGANAFAIDLYGALREEPGNLFLSPWSVSAALAMTYAGASGSTAEEMQQALHLPLPPEQLHPAFQALLARQAAPAAGAAEGDALSVANALWAQRGTAFQESFLSLVRERYGARAEQVDFVGATEEARQTINAWVSERTRAKIPNLLPEGLLTSQTRLVLTNAIYFKGSWGSAFEASNTKDRPFHAAGGASVTVPLMTQTEAFPYAESPDAQVLELPYKGDGLSMIVLLPRERDGLAALEAALTLESLERWTSGLRTRKVQVHLPRFSTRSKLPLKAPLQALGMREAFDVEKADFSGFTGQRDLYLTAVVHEAFVDVNEEGTEAAAATGAVVGVRSAPARPPVFRADHPFLFLIRERESGLVLFLGRLTNPSP